MLDEVFDEALGGSCAGGWDESDHLDLQDLGELTDENTMQSRPSAVRGS